MRGSLKKRVARLENATLKKKGDAELNRLLKEYELSFNGVSVAEQRRINEEVLKDLVAEGVLS